MIFAILIDPVLSKFVILSMIILVVGFLLRVIKQPSIVTYLIVGVLVGPYGFRLITDEILITNLGSLGLVLLLFFVGMEIHLPNLITNWRVSVLGTLIQISVSIIIVWFLSATFNWKINQVVMLGFVISLSSTAVIVKLLQERNELMTKVGQNVLGVLIAQDILIVPMLIIMSYMGGDKPHITQMLKQLIGGVLIIGIIIYILKKKEIKLPFMKYIEKDHEVQVFVAFTLCFGFSILTAFLGLSSALGAFIAGIILSSTKSIQWVHDSLHAFKIMFVALFFVSIGMLIDLQFLKENAFTIGLLVLIVFIVNNTINVLTMRIFCKDWKTSFYAGALLSQIGEFSFILGSSGYYLGIIKIYDYQLVISAIALTLFLSPFWINLSRKIIGGGG
ncbi:MULTISPECIES: cation:proton antiporter [Carboxylicivirga]|uniref:Cation:proton antiporter n=1 Tax=Carboxylicivirga linearis TaxID=1628157 RepID=A0ABS5K303_9BACT|nr:cation:proton antiporter [Carboxylicivirga linearis]MBS2100856.1 cation:proton antiporter [Carboxylicivirga linearis]MCU4166545.1 cation:proton antiporter [Marinilabiliaceae bacterium A049]